MPSLDLLFFLRHGDHLNAILHINEFIRGNLFVESVGELGHDLLTGLPFLNEGVLSLKDLNEECCEVVFIKFCTLPKLLGSL